ncbi:MAG TPA: hypothetical protein PKC99_06125 [Anaerolineales bacterium]|nr:hypothetical protein [Anaerolineales bacterium]
MSAKVNPPRGSEKPWPRPVIGVPMERTLAHADKVFYNLIGIAQQGWPFISIGYGRTDLARNRMALHLLSSDFTHLVMLDADHAHPLDIVQRLMTHFVVKPDLRVVGGLNFRRGEPYDPCAFIRGDDEKYYPMAEWEKGLVKVDALGTGSIAIDRRVFEQIEPPWFYNDYSKVMDDVWPGEDMGFAEKCRLAGIEQWCDTTLTSPHLIDAVVDESAYRQYMQAHNMKSIPIESVRKEASNGS